MAPVAIQNGGKFFKITTARLKIEDVVGLKRKVMKKALVREPVPLRSGLPYSSWDWPFFEEVAFMEEYDNWEVMNGSGGVDSVLFLEFST